MYVSEYEGKRQVSVLAQSAETHGAITSNRTCSVITKTGPSPCAEAEPAAWATAETEPYMQGCTILWAGPGLLDLEIDSKSFHDCRAFGEWTWPFPLQ